MATTASRSGPRASSPGWPAGSDADVLVLRFASTAGEREVLDDWLEGSRPDSSRVGVVDVDVPGTDLDAALSEAGEDTWVAPVRVAWLPRERGGARAARISDLLAFRDPRRPGERAQRRILRSGRDRCRVIVAEPARAGELRRRHGSDGAGAFGEFVGRQAVLALDRAERNLFGTQYKVPRFVSEEISAGGRLRDAVAGLAGRLGRPEDEVAREAQVCIDEMVASQSELAIDAWGQFGRWLARAYTIEVDEGRLDELRALGARYPLAFVPAHRSYLDPLVLRSALLEHGFPPNHVLGGVNVGFWPIGPVARRSGYVFIRRSFRDNPVYTLALRQYIAFLLRKRFSVEWYIEGGRSRTGKLRPPRYGLLSYVVDAFRDGGMEDAFLVPVSIVYDQLHEVGAMAAEEHGAKKQKEGIGWLVDYARSQGRGLGKVRVCFGEPLSLREGLAEGEGGGEGTGANAVEKVAFEVCHRINRATPITPTALLTLALLGVEDRALVLPEVRGTLEPLLDYVERRELPLAGDADLRQDEGVRTVLDALVRGGVISVFDEGVAPVWSVGPDRHLEAAFYRNAVVHFFVNRAITELVLARVAEGGGADLREEGWQEAWRLRDLLKFEFFFPRRRDFDVEVREELALFDAGWEARPLEPKQVWATLAEAPLHVAHRVLRPFLEAYQVVADRLADRDPGEAVEESELLTECTGAAHQYRLQRRLHSPESISRETFKTALRLAANRGLLDPGGAELAERRCAFAEELRAEVGRVAAVRDLALRGLDSAEAVR